VYQLVVYVHLLAVIAWLGGVVFIALVLVPVTRGTPDPPGASVRVLRAAARRFLAVAWVALLTLVGSGIWILMERGVSSSDIFTGDGQFLRYLRIKLGLVVLVLVLSAFHDFVLGPRLARKLEDTRAKPESDAAIARERKRVAWLARVNAALALVIVALGVILVRGTPF
jgi:uncharacterized membrane protein